MIYAYKNKEKTELINVNEATEHTNYYCINPNCKAVLRACALDSTLVPAHFSALISPHVDKCPYSSSNINIKKYHINNFDLDNFFSNLCSEQILLNVNPPSTSYEHHVDDTLNQNQIPLPNSLLKVYKYCLNLSLEDKLSNKKVIEILADLRSEYFYTKFILGNKIVEGKLIYIDYKSKILTIQYPAHLEKKENRKYIYLKIKLNYPVNMDIFELNKIYIIGGNFNKFEITLYNKKQIKCLKK
ncbi:hypothetical protein [Cetobacterium somerae]